MKTIVIKIFAIVVLSMSILSAPLSAAPAQYSFDLLAASSSTTEAIEANSDTNIAEVPLQSAPDDSVDRVIYPMNEIQNGMVDNAINYVKDHVNYFIDYLNDVMSDIFNF